MEVELYKYNHYYFIKHLNFGEESLKIKNTINMLHLLYRETETQIIRLYLLGDLDLYCLDARLV